MKGSLTMVGVIRVWVLFLSKILLLSSSFFFTSISQASKQASKQSTKEVPFMN
jgi:hypothetical protein